jgi:hypothetical protein
MGVLVLGAGVAGLTCARALADAGRSVRVLEKSTVLGGRLATRTLGGIPFAYGAPDLAAVGEPDVDVRAWIARLAEGLGVEYGKRATRVVPRALGASVTLDDGSTLEGVTVVIAVPAPQAAELLGPALAGPLGSARYERSVVGAWRMAEADDLDVTPASPLIARVVQRGLVRVAHARPGPSEARWDDLDEAWLAALEDELARLDLPVAGGARFLKRWRYAFPSTPVRAPYHRVSLGLVVCGDAFAPDAARAGTTAAARASGAAAASALLAGEGRLPRAQSVGT